MANAHDTGLEMAKATPPIAVTAWSFLGHDLNDFVAPLTILYIVLQIFFLFRKNWLERKKQRAPRKKTPPPIDLPDEMPDGE